MKEQGKNVATTASTGMAAQNYTGGTTVHHWCGIGDGRYTDTALLAVIQHTETAKRIVDSDVLTIDEVGMLSATVFETVEYICRNIRQIDRVFGGLQIVTCGDFKQLPPVPNILHDDAGLHCFTSKLFDLAFPHTLNLTDVKRQDDPVLIKAVRELCDGEPSTETTSFLKSLGRPLLEEPTLLFGTNFDADFINHERLCDIPGEQTVYRSEDSGDRRWVKKIQAPKLLALKVGAPVILTRNVNSLLSNGTRGTVYKLGLKPIVNFNGKLVEVNKYKFDIFQKDAGAVKASRHQFPLKLAFALTVHRAQGQTLPCVEVDCYSFFAPGQLGVAIGRSVSADKLRVLNYNVSAVSKHQPEVYEYYKRLTVGQCYTDLSCCKAKPFVSNSNNANLHKDQPVSKFEHVHVHQVTGAGSDENSSSPTISTLDPRIEPIDFETFTSENPMPFNDDLLTNHVRVIQSKMLELMPANKQSKESWTRTYEKINLFLVSETHQALIRELFVSDTISKSQNKYATKLCFYIHDRLVDIQASSIASGQRLVGGDTPTIADLSDAAKSKIRYIGGACLSKITGRLRLKAVSNITCSANRASRRAAYRQNQLLGKLLTSEADTVAQTTIPESLSEIDVKQGPTRGLYHMSDDVYRFFVSLNLKTTELLSKNMFEVEGENAFLKCRETVFNDDSLNTTWSTLLLNKETDEVIRELQDCMCHELFCMVSEHFIRIQFVDALHQLKESIPRTKKLALRAKIQGATNDRGTKRNIIEGEYIYVCPICNTVCSDEPQTASEQSIGCDGCNRWYHQTCVGLTDATKLKVWKCRDCKKNKFQRRR